MKLPIHPPYAPMEARRVEKIPAGDLWQFEPKWDGFRAVVFRDGDEVFVQSKAGQPLARYFPELVEAVRALKPKQFVLDGEIVVPVDGRLSFDDLLQRIHPAESRIRRLAAETPAHYYVWSSTTTSRRVASATARSSSAGGPTRRRSSARWNRCPPDPRTE